MKKLLLAVLSVCLFVVAFGAVEITYMNYSALPSHEETLKLIVKEFEKKNPGIKIKLVNVPWDDYFLKLSTSFAGNDAPDTFEINYENFVEYASDGLLLPLDSLNKQFNFNANEIFAEKAYKAFSHNAVQYGFPEKFSTVVLFYNKKLFDEKKLAYPTNNWTWKEEMEAAKKLTDSKKGIWGVYQPVQFWEFYKVLTQAGGSFITANKASLNSKAGIDAVNWLVDKQKLGVMPTDAQAGGLKSEDLFVAGKVAMVHTGIWMFKMFRDEASFDWDIVVEPGMESKGTHYFVDGVVASKNTKHKEEAWKWIKFLTTSEYNAKLRYEKGWELPAISNEKYLEPFLTENSKPANKKAIFESLSYSSLPPVIKGWSALSDIVNKELSDVALGNKTAQDALKAIDIEINKKLGK
ncbi:MAG TPA: sugar ABC transporter substrate-binding protein [Petrotogaceae bacterium]|nr:sugar ABC transporter substrate-binding protein [Petrotogaceae bacterium]